MLSRVKVKPRGPPISYIRRPKTRNSLVMTVTFPGVVLLTMRVTRFAEHQLPVFLRSRACSCASGSVPGTK